MNKMLRMARLLIFVLSVFLIFGYVTAKYILDGPARLKEQAALAEFEQ